MRGFFYVLIVLLNKIHLWHILLGVAGSWSDGNASGRHHEINDRVTLYAGIRIQIAGVFTGCLTGTQGIV